MKYFHLISKVFAASVTFFLTGCHISLTNLTPKDVPQNPSGIYTLGVSAEITDGNVDSESIEASVVIDGKKYPMVPSEGAQNVFQFDYALPKDRDSAKYYFEVDYTFETGSGKVRTEIGELSEFFLTNRYVVTLETSRAPVGTVVPVLGRGFTPSDTIIMGPIAADTRYVSENVIEFTVPGLMAGESYDVVWESGYGNVPMGKFRIDAANITVIPESLSLSVGSSRALTFDIDSPAPPGGLAVQVTTDVPESVIMPEVVIPAGQRTVTVQVQGGAIGAGSLFVSIAGQGEITIPVIVN
ncbi:MAG: cell surface protein [Verrucomicrobiota bacterium]